jgi:hypothetical protein
VPLFCEVLGTRRKAVSLTFTEEEICFLLGTMAKHLLLELTDELIVVTIVFVGKQVIRH